jgi:hypothetical protein
MHAGASAASIKNNQIPGLTSLQDKSTLLNLNMGCSQAPTAGMSWCNHPAIHLLGSLVQHLT